MADRNPFDLLSNVLYSNTRFPVFPLPLNKGGARRPPQESLPLSTPRRAQQPRPAYRHVHAYTCGRGAHEYDRPPPQAGAPRCFTRVLLPGCAYSSVRQMKDGRRGVSWLLVEQRDVKRSSGVSAVSVAHLLCHHFCWLPLTLNQVPIKRRAYLLHRLLKHMLSF